MTARNLAIIALIFTTILIASLCAVFSTRSTSPDMRTVQKSNPLTDRPNMVDRLDFFDTPATLDNATMEHVTLVTAASTTQPTTAQSAASGRGQLVSTSGPHLILSDRRIKSFPRAGTWTSDVTEAAMPFTEMIPSWNAIVPADTGVFFHIKTRDAKTHTWSPWLYIGQWGRTPRNDPADRVVEFDHGIVNVDNLMLDLPADAYQIRATLLSFAIDPEMNPSVRRISVSYSGQVDDPQLRERLTRNEQIEPPARSDRFVATGAATPNTKPIESSNDWARSLPVPFRAQGVEAKPLSGQICSPTSTSMVMAYCGIDLPTQENALAIYDEDHDMFGNWNRAVQRAGSLGLDAWIQRFRNWDQVKPLIARGQPIVAGIKFKKGEFPSALYSETAGHLIVIRGFTSDGNVIVNDPANHEKGNGVTYKANELGRAWFGHGGVGYVIRNPEGKPVSTGGRS